MKNFIFLLFASFAHLPFSHGAVDPQAGWSVLQWGDQKRTLIVQQKNTWLGEHLLTKQVFLLDPIHLEKLFPKSPRNAPTLCHKGLYQLSWRLQGSKLPQSERGCLEDHRFTELLDSFQKLGYFIKN